MGELRTQLQAARAEYRSIRYSGDLADLLLPPTPTGSQWRMGRIIAAAGLAAACAAMVLVSHMGANAGARAGTPSLVADARIGIQRVAAIVPAPTDARVMAARGNMAQAVTAAAPPEVAEWLMAVKEPVVTSGRYIVSLGKDLAHLADALFEMG